MGHAFSTSIIYGQSTNHKDHELKWKKQGVVTYNVHRENKVSKMFIISHGNSIGPESTPGSQAVHTLEYGPLTQPITAHLVTKRYDNKIYF